MSEVNLKSNTQTPTPSADQTGQLKLSKVTDVTVLMYCVAEMSTKVIMLTSEPCSHPGPKLLCLCCKHKHFSGP